MVRAKVYVYLKKDILDPQGKALKHILGNMGFGQVQDVRTGKYTVLTFDDAISKKEAATQTEEICKKILANPVIEEYHFEIEKI